MIYRDYSNLAIIKWLRKKIFRIDKPPYVPFGRWERWHALLRKEHPVAWFFTETIPNFFEKIVGIFLDPVVKFKEKWVMKKIIKPHIIKTGLSPLHQHDYKKKFLYALYQELVDYVEVTLANRWIGWSIVQQRKYNFPRWKKYWWLNWKPWRCAEAGIDSLKWQADLHDEASSSNRRAKMIIESSQEIMLLYSWWVHIRPERGSSWERVGLDEFVRQLHERYGVDALRQQWTTEEDQKYQILIDQQEQLEHEWEIEDHSMMIRLVNISPHLVY